MAPRPVATRGAWRSRASSSLLIAQTLRLLDAARGPLRAARVDHGHARTLVETKLLLDLQGHGGASGAAAAGLILPIVGMWMLGIVPGVIGLVTKSPDAWIGAGQGLVLGMLAMLLLAQYGPMLVDATDVALVGPMPVSSRTLFASRLIHVGIYTGILTANAAFFPTLLGCFAFPPWIVPWFFPLCTLLTTLLAIGAIGVFYGVLLRVAGPSSFQRVAFWMQVAAAVAAFGGIQWIAQIAPYGKIANAIELDSPWLLLLPPRNQIGLYHAIQGDLSALTLAHAAIALVAPFALLALALALASRQFQAALASSDHSPRRARATWKRGPIAALGERATREREELAGYQFTLALSRRERLFLRTALPLLLGTTAAFTSLSLPLSRVEVEALGGVTMAPLYFVLILVPAVFEVAGYSEDARAQWLLRVLPIERPSAVVRGSVKALLVGTMLPLVVALAIASWSLSPDARVADGVLYLELVSLAALVAAVELRHPMAFSRFPRANDANYGILAAIGVMTLVALGCGLIHVAARIVPWVQGATIVALAPALVSAWRRLDAVRAEPLDAV